MRLSDRYAMREAISPFLFGIAAFTAIFVASDIVFKVADLVASGSAGLADVIMLLLYKLPYVATLTFPMAMLLGSLLGMAAVKHPRVRALGGGLTSPADASHFGLLVLCVSVLALRGEFVRGSSCGVRADENTELTEAASRAMTYAVA